MRTSEGRKVWGMVWGRIEAIESGLRWSSAHFEHKGRGSFFWSRLKKAGDGSRSFHGGLGGFLELLGGGGGLFHRRGGVLGLCRGCCCARAEWGGAVVGLELGVGGSPLLLHAVDVQQHLDPGLVDGVAEQRDGLSDQHAPLQSGSESPCMQCADVLAAVLGGDRKGVG